MTFQYSGVQKKKKKSSKTVKMPKKYEIRNVKTDWILFLFLITLITYLPDCSSLCSFLSSCLIFLGK